MKSKAYSIAFIEGDSFNTKQSAKGVNESVKSTLHHEKYKSVLLEGTSIKESMKIFVSRNHFLSIDDVNKIALLAFDNKRFYDNDEIKSLAFSHFRTGPKSNYTKSAKKILVTKQILKLNVKIPAQPTQTTICFV